MIFNSHKAVQLAVLSETSDIVLEIMDN